MVVYDGRRTRHNSMPQPHNCRIDASNKLAVPHQTRPFHGDDTAMVPDATQHQQNDDVKTYSDLWHQSRSPREKTTAKAFGSFDHIDYNRRTQTKNNAKP